MGWRRSAFCSNIRAFSRTSNSTLSRLPEHASYVPWSSRQHWALLIRHVKVCRGSCSLLEEKLRPEAPTHDAPRHLPLQSVYFPSERTHSTSIASHSSHHHLWNTTILFNLTKRQASSFLTSKRESFAPCQARRSSSARPRYRGHHENPDSDSDSPLDDLTSARCDSALLAAFGTRGKSR